MKISIKDLESIKERISLDLFKNKKILLIGSEGFLGSWFCEIFDYIEVEYFKYDPGINPNYDINTPIDLPRYDYVINCAGIASPEKYMKEPILTMDISYIGTKNVLDYCNKYKVESVLLFSSSEVYGTPIEEAIPTKEEYIGSIPTRGNRSCYDIGKQVLETLCHIYYNEFSTPVKVIRPFNMYGPYMGINDNRVLSNWMKSILNGDKITIYGDGRQTRTFCYAADGIAMILELLLKGSNGEVYNVGNPSPELNMIQLANKFYESLNLEPNYDLIPYPSYYPSDEPLRRCPSIDKAVKQTNILPKVDLKTGLKSMLDYFKLERN